MPLTRNTLRAIVSESCGFPTCASLLMNNTLRSALVSLVVSTLLAASTAQALPTKTVPDSMQTSGFVAITAGYGHTCALTNGGGVKCWGDNSSGQLGDGTSTSRSVPRDVTGLTSGVTAISAGYSHSCALIGTGVIKCWGANWYGQLGDGTTTTRYLPTSVISITNDASAISAGNAHTCAVTGGGGVKCWGRNQDYRLGDGTTTDRWFPVAVSSISTGTTAVSAGYAHTCAIVNGGAKCWGFNGAGQLGDGTNTSRPAPIDVAGLSSGVTLLAAGSWHTCARAAPGIVKCWGSDQYGELGIGGSAGRTTPVTVTALLADVVQIGAGTADDNSYSCALSVAGAVSCWGANRYGQIGDGSTSNKSYPADVIGLSPTVNAIGTGMHHACAIAATGMYCWGSNSNGQLGDGTVTRSARPGDVFGLGAGVTGMGSGDWGACAVVGGLAKCWGNNRSKQLGNAAAPDSSVPADVTVSGLGAGITVVDGALDANCAIVGGAVKCWSYGSVSSFSAMTAGVTSLASAYVHNCAIVNGGAKCWGMNNNGQLGDGTTTGSGPVDVVGLASGVSSIAVGTSYSCAVVLGSARCWGANYSGQLGDGTATQRSLPITVTGLTGGIAAIVAGQSQACALTTGGGVKCWGWNGSGGVGDGTYAQRFAPVDVLGLSSGVVALASASDHTCALMDGGIVKCWGGNSRGQLGDGTTTSRNAPVEVQGLGPGVTAIMAGGLNYEGHTCALLGSGAMKCWGDNKYGQLGDNAPIVRTRPVTVTGITGQPELNLDYPSGLPGSHFRVVGTDFPANAIAAITVDGVVAGHIKTDSFGGFLFFVSTANANLGTHHVSATVNPTATTTFTLASNAPLRQKEGSGTVLSATPANVFVPAVAR